MPRDSATAQMIVCWSLAPNIVDKVPVRDLRPETLVDGRDLPAVILDLAVLDTVPAIDGVAVIELPPSEMSRGGRRLEVDEDVLRAREGR